MPKAGRGVIYMVWGQEIEPVLQRSIASLKQHHPELPVEVVRAAADPNSLESLREKASMYERSPFAETLYLDADTVVLDRLDYGFEKAYRFGLACCISEVPWARHYRGLADRGDMLDYNTGVIFFTDKAKPVFDLWPTLAREIDASMIFPHEGKTAVRPFNDQASFSASLERADFSPFVLSLNWNFRYGAHKNFHGPLKIWHAYPPPPASMRAISDYYRRPDSMIQYVELE